MKKLIREIKLRDIIFLLAGAAAAFLPTAANGAFEDIGNGARPIGLGNAYCALADDVYTVYYNPAGLAKIRRAEVASDYGRLYAGLDDGSNLGNSFLGYAQPLKNNNGGIGFGYLNFSLTGFYEENTFIFSYARSVSKPISLGVNFKILQKIVGQDMYTRIDPVFDYGNRSSKTGYSFDVGSLYDINSKLSLALSFKNVNQPDMIFYPTQQVKESIVPCEIRGGMAYREGSLNIATDVSLKEKDLKVYTGAEKWLTDRTFALRGGLGLGSREFRNAVIGASYKVNLFRFDYAFNYPLAGIEDTYGSHHFSLTLFFGPSEEEIEKEAVINKLEKELESTEKSLNEAKTKVEKASKEAENARLEAERMKLEAENARDSAEKMKVAQEAAKQAASTKKAYESAMEKEQRQNFNYWYLTGERYVKYGEFEDALKAYEKAMNFKPGDYKTQNEIEYVKVEIAKRSRKPEPEKERINTYTVRDGDVLPGIAEKIYGDPSRWKDIYDANKDGIVEGKLKTGQILDIP